jgi:hypothetical protein
MTAPSSLPTCPNPACEQPHVIRKRSRATRMKRLAHGCGERACGGLDCHPHAGSPPLDRGIGFLIYDHASVSYYFLTISRE